MLTSLAMPNFSIQKPNLDKNQVTSGFSEFVT